MLQASWDTESIFIHRKGKKNQKVDHLQTDFEFSYYTIIKCLIDCKDTTCKYVFHAQSSLFALIMARIVCILTLNRRATLVYDMHDKLEKSDQPDLYSYLRYNLIRYYVLSILEYIVYKDSRILKITVSDGLAEKISLKYNCKIPSVVMSAPKPRLNANELGAIERRKNTILYFGQISRAPLDMLENIDRERIQLHLYGRDITKQSVERAIKQGLPERVSIMGEYSPSDLGFIDSYSYLLLYNPHIDYDNYKYSLPNKFFQALNSGLSFIVSENFKEMIEILREVNGACVVYRYGESLNEIIMKLDKHRNESYFIDIVDYSNKLYKKSRNFYLNISNEAS